MRNKRNIIGRLMAIGVSVVLALCILSSASFAQSKDDRKDRTGDDRKRDEPKREEQGDRASSRDRTSESETTRESKDKPAKSSGDSKTREQPSRNDGKSKDRPSTGGSESGRDRNPPDRSGSTDKRTVPDRSTRGGTTDPDRRRPPRRPDGGDYDRSRGDDDAGTRPGNPDPPTRPPRRYPGVDDGDGTKRKEVPVPDDRVRIVVEGWPSPPPWHRPHLRKKHVYPRRFPKHDPYLIYLPFGTIRPQEIDEQFLLLLNDLWHDGMQDALLVCIVQTYGALEVDHFELFFDAEDEVTVYGSFTPNSFLVLVSVDSIYELLNDARIRWVGEYKPYYKINDSVRLWEYDGVFVFPLEDDSIEFREDLEDIYLMPEFYDEELGFYFIPAESYELEAIAEFWWVAEVLRVVSDPDLVYDYDYRTYE